MNESLTQQALALYRQALALYQAEQYPAGQAYTLAEIIRCQHQLGNEAERPQLALAALGMASSSHMPSVEHYVLRALYEACEQDDEKFIELWTNLTQGEA